MQSLSGVYLFCFSLIMVVLLFNSTALATVSMTITIQTDNIENIIVTDD